jgi:O-antigen/teichoic acid export membrane protein
MRPFMNKPFPNFARERSRELIKSDFVQKVMEMYGSRLAVICLGLLNTVVVARFLGPEGRGQYAVATAIGTLAVQFGNLGLHVSNIYYVSQRKGYLPQLLGNSLVVSVALGGALAGLTAFIFVLNPDWIPAGWPLLSLALLFIPLGLFYILAQNLLLGIYSIRSYNLIEVSVKMILVLLLGLFLLIGSVSVESFFSAGVIASLIACGWTFVAIKSHMHEPLSVSLGLLKKTLSYGFRSYLTAFFVVAIWRISLLMVKFLLGDEEAGYYSIAISIADFVLLLPLLVGTLMLPKLSSIPEPDKKWFLTRKVVLYVSIAMLVIIGIAAILTEPMVVFLFGKEYLPSVFPFFWLLPGILFCSINTVYIHYYLSVGMPSAILYVLAVAMIVNLVLNYILIGWFGTNGAASSWTMIYAILLAFSSLYFTLNRKHLSSMSLPT